MENNLSETIWPVVKQYWIVIILALSGLTFFIYGLITFISTNQKPQDVAFEATNTKPVSESSQNLIAIDIEGQVVKPGVYKLKPNSLVQDGLVASGGLTALADRDWVAKNLNLALKLTAGQKIYIPKLGETSVINSSSVLSATDSNTSSLININSASESELEALPGIGPVTGAKIINNRPYATINDLISKKVVSSHVFDEIKDKIIAQ